jgi:sulfur carrier protein
MMFMLFLRKDNIINPAGASLSLYFNLPAILFLPAMEILLNGKPKDVEPGATLLSLLKEKGLKPGQVVVEVNQEIADWKRYDDILLRERDCVEILEFVGGG